MTDFERILVPSDVGEPSDRAVELAEKLDASLALLHTFGLARAFLGSVAEATSRASKVPVLTTRPAPRAAVA